MTITVGLVANVFNEVNALPGWLEAHTPFFDDIRILHAGPGGSYSNDGTLELLSKWHIPVEYCAIDDGFGVVRTKALRMSKCNYTMLLDADERFYAVHRVLAVHGNGTPQHEVDQILQSYDFRGTKEPNWELVGKLGCDLKVEFGNAYDQGDRLRYLLQEHIDQGVPIDAVATVRRHWHDLTLRRPTQDWRQYPDYQMRLVRNDPDIYFESSTRMHEKLVGVGKTYYADMGLGPFFDHFHFHFKRMEQEQRSHDIAIYDKVHANERPPTWDEFRSGI